MVREVGTKPGGAQVAKAQTGQESSNWQSELEDPQNELDQLERLMLKHSKQVASQSSVEVLEDRLNELLKRDQSSAKEISRLHTELLVARMNMHFLQLDLASLLRDTKKGPSNVNLPQIGLFPMGSPDTSIRRTELTIIAPSDEVSGRRERIFFRSDVTAMQVVGVDESEIYSNRSKGDPFIWKAELGGLLPDDVLAVINTRRFLKSEVAEPGSIGLRVGPEIVAFLAAPADWEKSCATLTIAPPVPRLIPRTPSGPMRSCRDPYPVYCRIDSRGKVLNSWIDNEIGAFYLSVEPLAVPIE